MRFFDLIGKMDIAPILEAIEENDDRWNDITFRQNTVGSPHGGTKTMFLRMPPGILDFDSIFNSLDVIDYPLMEVPAFKKAVDEVAKLAYAEPARAMIVKLFRDRSVKEHFDEGTYSDNTDRYHLCITTSGCQMFCGDEYVFMQPGEVWWIDKHATHSVQNGNEDRIHLIVDCWED